MTTSKVALRLARLISAKNDVTSIIRDPSQEDDILACGARPLVLSLEDDVSKFTSAFEDAEIVISQLVQVAKVGRK